MTAKKTIRTLCILVLALPGLCLAVDSLFPLNQRLLAAATDPGKASAAAADSGKGLTRDPAGIITDPGTGLQWYVGPDKATSWKEAKTWVAALALGGGWRMPTVAELRTLYQKGAGDRNLSPLFVTTGWWVWTGKEKDEASAWYFDFRLGVADWTLHHMAYQSPRAFAVRGKAKEALNGH